MSPSLGCDSPLDIRIKSAMLADLLTLAGLPVVDPIVRHPPQEPTIEPPKSVSVSLIVIVLFALI